MRKKDYRKVYTYKEREYIILALESVIKTLRDADEVYIAEMISEVDPKSRVVDLRISLSYKSK